MRIILPPELPPTIGPAILRTAGMAAIVLLAACTPRIAVEAPKEPIVVNVNVKIQHEVRVKVDRELDTLFKQNPELFGQ